MNKKTLVYFVDGPNGGGPWYADVGGGIQFFLFLLRHWMFCGDLVPQVVGVNEGRVERVGNLHAPCPSHLDEQLGDEVCPVVGK